MRTPRIVWLRRDLRLADQAAFHAAAQAGPVIPVYVLDDETPKHRAMGGASRWWLHHSLEALAAELEARGSRLVLRRGRAADELAKVAEETGASAIHALRHYEPWWRNAERALKEALPPDVAFHRHDGNFLLPPGSVTTGSGGQYKIFTPFYRALMERMPPASPLPEPSLVARKAGRIRTGWRIGGCFRRSPTGRADCGKHGLAGRAQPMRSWMISWAAPRNTKRRATCPRSMALRACRRIFISAKSLRRRCGTH